MKRVKPELVISFSAFLSFCVLCGLGSLFQTYPLVRTEVNILLCELLAFLPAMVFLHRFIPDTTYEVLRIPKRNHPFETFFFVCAASAAVTFLSFFLNYFVYSLLTLTNFSFHTAMVAVPRTLGSPASLVLSSVLIPALLEELYLRGIMHSVLVSRLNQTHLIFFSGFLFALLHASLQNFIGPFIAGIFYAWLVCVLGSVWYAILAHCIHSVLYNAIAWLVEFFNTFGIWSRFPAISLICFLLFLYIALRLTERLVIHRRFHRITQKKTSFRFLTKLFSNVATVALLVAFVAKAILGII